MDRNVLKNQVAEIIVEILQESVDTSAVKQAHFFDILDSVSFVELIVKLEETFNIEIDDEYLLLDKMSNCDAVVNMLLTKIK